MNFRFVKSRLKRTIERGLADGNLREQLRELGDLTLKSRTDGEDVCWGLQKLNSNSQQLANHAYALALLFQEVDDADSHALEILRERGIPELLRIFDQILQAPADDEINTLLFILKILALYGTTDGTLKVIESAQRPLKPDGYMWTAILGNFQAGHPQNELLYGSLSDPLPAEFIGVALLDAANAAMIAGEEMSHPFDSTEGRQRLRDWLSRRDPEDYSYAHSATAALPFISNPEGDVLLNAAMSHPDVGVQIESAWAAAIRGRDEGLGRLAERCLDYRYSQQAKQYLKELDREDVIPAEANRPEFSTLAEFAQWLAHPNELGRAPDEVEIVDQRELCWPPGKS